MQVEANIQSIIITNSIGLVLLFCLFVTSYLTRERSHIDDRMFTCMIIVCAGACVFEAATWVVNAQPGIAAYLVNLLGNTYLYVATNIYAYLWVLYVDLRLHKGATRIRRWYPALLVPTAILTLANLGNIFGQYMFTIDEMNVYSRLPLSYINYVLAFVMLFFSIWQKRAFQKAHGPVRFFPVLVFIVPIFCGALIQAVFYGISIAWVSVAIGLVSIHMSQQNELSYVDSLTNLYNRAYLDYALRNMTQKGNAGGGIMVDVDSFKSINDTYGHSVGDDALRATARILAENSPTNTLNTRFAGDEFIVLVKTDDEADLVRIEKDVHAAVEAFNRAESHPYTLSLSMGHAMFEENKDTEDTFLRRMDIHMYADKRTKHLDGTLPDRRTRR